MSSGTRAEPQIPPGSESSRTVMAGRAGAQPFHDWLSPPGVTILVSTALALGLRLFTLTRPGFLTGTSEYDDGIYLGAAIRRSRGSLSAGAPTRASCTWPASR